MARMRLPEDHQEPRELTRKGALLRGAGAIAGLSVGAQVMAATGADTAFAAGVREAVSRVHKPGYGPLVQHTGEMSLPAGFHVTAFGAAGSPMSDGILTPTCHDGTTCVGAGTHRVRLLRNHEGYDLGRSLGPSKAYDRVAQGGVTTSLFDTRLGVLVESALVLNGTDNNCNGGPTRGAAGSPARSRRSAPARGTRRSTATCSGAVPEP